MFLNYENVLQLSTMCTEQKYTKKQRIVVAEYRLVCIIELRSQ